MRRSQVRALSAPPFQKPHEAFLYHFPIVYATNPADFCRFVPAAECSGLVIPVIRPDPPDRPHFEYCSGRSAYAKLPYRHGYIFCSFCCPSRPCGLRNIGSAPSQNLIQLKGPRLADEGIQPPASGNLLCRRQTRLESIEARRRILNTAT